MKREIAKIYNIKTQMFKRFQKDEKVYDKMRNYRSSARIRHIDFEIRIHNVKM